MSFIKFLFGEELRFHDVNLWLGLLQHIVTKVYIYKQYHSFHTKEMVILLEIERNSIRLL